MDGVSFPCRTWGAGHGPPTKSMVSLRLVRDPSPSGTMPNAVRPVTTLGAVWDLLELCGADEAGRAPVPRRVLGGIQLPCWTSPCSLHPRGWRLACHARWPP